MGFDQPTHWLVVIAIAALLFGYKKLPDASRSLGRSLRIFKTELKGLGEDDKAREGQAEASAGEVVAPAAPVADATPVSAPVAPAAPVAAPVAAAPVAAPVVPVAPAQTED